MDKTVTSVHVWVREWVLTHLFLFAEHQLLVQVLNMTFGKPQTSSDKLTDAKF